MGYAIGAKVTLLRPTDRDPIKLVMCPQAQVCEVLPGPSYMLDYPWEYGGGVHFAFGPIGHDRLKAGWPYGWPR